MGSWVPLAVLSIPSPLLQPALGTGHFFPLTKCPRTFQSSPNQ